MLACLSGPTSARAAVLTDGFSARETLESPTGSLQGSTVGTTREAGEPRHAQHGGGHSVWMRWIAPAAGLAEFSAAGSSFDAVLAVYRVQGNAGGFEGLERAADRDDDDLEAPTVPFAVQAGEVFEIAVDGYGEAVGDVLLSWRLFATSAPLPVLVSVPNQQAVLEGQSIRLTVALSATDDVEYRWYRNGKEVDNGESATLEFPAFSQRHVGRYKVRIKYQDVIFDSDTVELQINSEGQSTALARNKLFEALESSLRPEPDPEDQDDARPASSSGLSRASARRPKPANLPIGVVRGLHGTQIFDTTLGTRDADEPQHCGVPGGASYWFGYQCIEAGTLRFDTTGTGFQSVLAVYTYDGALTSYAQLIPLGCAVAAAATEGAQVTFEAQPGRTYVAVLDGVNGARGPAQLTYTLQRPTPPGGTAPTVTNPPLSQTLVESQPLLLAAQASGTAPLFFQWWLNGLPLPSATSAVWSVPSVALTDAGDYQLVVTNAFGAATSQVATVTVQRPPRILSLSGPSTARSAQRVTFSVEADGTPPLSFQWLRDGLEILGATGSQLRIEAATLADQGTYRVRISNAAGNVQSDGLPLTLLDPPQFILSPASQTLVEGSPLNLTCDVRGIPAPTLQWSLNGVALPGATGASFSVSAIAAAHAGAYQVMASNAAGVSLSAPAQIEVLVPPRILALGAGLVLAEGAPFTIRVDAGGSGPLEFQWRLNGADLPGARQDTFSVQQCTSRDAGTYRVRVSNAAGSVESDDVPVTVVSAPRFETLPQPAVVGVGGQARFTASGYAGPGGRLQWFHGDQALPGADQWTLELLQCTALQGGAYSLMVSNLAGQATSPPVELTVHTRARTSLETGSGTLRIGFPAPPGVLCVLQSAASLDGPWTDVATLESPSSAWIESHLPWRDHLNSGYLRCLHPGAGQGFSPAAAGSPTPSAHE